MPNFRPGGSLTEPVFFFGGELGAALGYFFFFVPGTVPELVFQPADLPPYGGQMPPFTPPCSARATAGPR